MAKAYEVPRVRLLNNLRPLDGSALPRRPSARDLREGMSESHLGRIRLLPCIITREYGRVEAHHLKSRQARLERGVFLKSADWWSVPLDWKVHWRLEQLASRYEPGYFAAHALRIHEIAKDLWAESVDGDLLSLSRMHDVQRRHWDEADEIMKRTRAAGGLLP